MPPDTTITGKPSAISGPTVTFLFSSSEPYSTFECKLDQASFAACSSPAMYAGLAAGAHHFEVRAVDTSANRDPSPATYDWQVDLNVLDTTITDAPPATSGRTATFRFTATRPGTFECELQPREAAFTSCASPKTYTNLSQSENPYTFLVRAIDGASNVDASPATYTWNVDSVGPTVNIAAPMGTTNAMPTIAFSTEPRATYTCRIDNATPFACVSGSKPPSALSEGPHIVYVQGTDEFGNLGVEASQGFTVDATPPTFNSFTGPANGSTTGANVIFSFSISDGTIACAIDGAPPPGGCASPASVTGLWPGSHSFSVTATDSVGNATTITRTWTVVAPTSSWALDIGQALLPYRIAVHGDKLFVAGEFTGATSVLGKPLANQGSKDSFVSCHNVQDGSIVWATPQGSANEDQSKYLAVDADRVYVAGRWNDSTGTVEAGSHAHAAALSSVDGHTVWQKIITPAAAADSFVFVSGVALTQTGVVVAGKFQGTLNLGGNDLVAPKAATFSFQERAIFVASFDKATGNHQWSFKLADTRDGMEGFATPHTVEYDKSGNVVLVGNFRETIDIDPATPSPITTTHASGELFVARYAQANGAFASVWRFPGTDGGSVALSAHATSDNGLVLCGAVSSSTVNYGGVDLLRHGIQDSFVVKLAPTGAHLWSKRFGTSKAAGQFQYGGNSYPYGCDLAGRDNVLVHGLVTPDNVALGAFTLTPSSPADFLAKLSTDDGTPRWAFVVNDGTPGKYSGMVAVDATGSFYIAGGFSGSTGFNPKPLSAVGNPDGYLVGFGP